MVLGFFQNACILIAFLSVVQHLISDIDIFQEKSLNRNASFGFYYGILGIILMLNGVHITSAIIVDFRYIPILISALYGGLFSSILTSIIIGIFRFFFLGITSSSINGLITALLIGIGFGNISKLNLSNKNKWIYFILYFIIIISISSWVAMNDEILFVRTMFIYFLGYLIISYFIIKYIIYIIEIQNIYQKLKIEATKDFLTGLNNVRQFDDLFNNMTQLTMRKEEDLSLLFIDIDFFKKINDVYGHNAGDSVLRSLAPILINTCRAYDIVSRNGGEEFSILLLDCSATKAVHIAERVRKNVENNVFYIADNKTINITVSIGVSSYPERTNQINNLIENSDTALYHAKKTGRNKVILFDNDI
ncbi:MAG: diguanylate cyclase [Bacillota bacterium]|nr:diguanylate cyclase [Bacillota bacterium]